jgi:hypothetical protein
VTGDHIRQQLAERLKVELSEWTTFVAEDGHRAIGMRERPQTADEIAAALEQTVRDLIAEHLNTAAREVDDWAEDMGDAQPLVQYAVTGAALKVYRRAAAVRARTEETT